MKIKILLPVLLAGLFFACPLAAQNLTQTVKGVAVDKNIKTPLVGATVVLLDPQNGAVLQGAMTDADGRFRLNNVPVGRQTIRVSYLGYKEAVLSNLVVNSGKELELNVELEESVLESKEVVIRARAEKDKPLNEFSTVSARTFSVEETQRYAAAVNDPARMASSFAGVVIGSDGNNTIVIRGNAPNGLLWRMEGVDIPNPNHFSAVGSSGGGISILSAQLLANSDFMTGAFAAEYGNALSGVFDLRLRKGNSEKFEGTLQAGVLGLDAAVEGPFRIGKQTGSFLVNYRYSTLSLLSRMGVNIGDGQTDFQDLSFNVWMPAGKAGTFTLFGMGGLSSQEIPGITDSIRWQEEFWKKYPNTYLANTGIVGLTHSKIWGSNTYVKTIAAFSGMKNGFQLDEYQPDYSARRIQDQDFSQTKWTVSSVLNHKFNARNVLRAGVYINVLNFDFAQYEWDDDFEFLRKELDNSGRTTTVNAFAQWQFRPTDRLTLNAGLHSFHVPLNAQQSVEPRAALKYAFSPRQSISLGYGLHSQMQPLGVYYVQDSDGRDLNPDLDLTRAHHFVLSFDQSLPGNMRFKAETYYQSIFDAPVSREAGNTFSMLNNVDGFVYEPLINNGLGRNYGLELTVEKFLTRGLYFLLSSSTYKSEYRDNAGVWRSSRFDGRFANTLTAGKEWTLERRGKNRVLGFNLKLVQMGGLRSTPIDLEASRQAGEAVYDLSRAYSDQMPGYFRLDVGFRLKRNYERLTTTLSLDIQNTTNRKNVFDRFYDPEKEEIKYFYQTPLIPVLSYRVEF